MGRLEFTLLVGALGAVSFPAFAQDWTGNWGGILLGYGSGTYDQGVSALNEPGPTVDVDGALVGLRFSRNVQRDANVFGFDIEVSTGIDGTTPVRTLTSSWSCSTGECNIDIKSLMTLRGRYGWLVEPETLLYGAGGLAVGKIDGGIFNSEQQGTSTAVGYTIGFGAERFINQTTTIFGEVNYMDLGNLDFGSGGDLRDVYDGEGDFATVKLGVNFQF